MYTKEYYIYTVQKNIYNLFNMGDKSRNIWIEDA